MAVVVTGIFSLASFNANAGATWAVDPSLPGPNQPAQGLSLFDQIASDGVPFPFEALVRKIESRAGCAPGRCMTSVLVPLGRSLQRSTASPDFFRFPRVITAMTSEGHGPFYAKDGIYLGYQERAEVIEIISYNEAAGRFEFQLVRNYRANATPTVVDANRAVCIACHQNHAPIFSRPQWDETNANPRIAAALMAQRPTKDVSPYGVPIARGVDLPNAIDDATDRANQFGVTQRIWRDACNDACRRLAVAAALQYRLSQEQGFDARTGIAASFAKTWPDGLAIPNPDLPNRDPFVLAADGVPSSRIDLAAVFEALTPRAPSAIWKGEDPLLESHFVAGLAALISETDVRELEATLSRQARSSNRRTLGADCAIEGERYRCDGAFSLTGIPTRIERLRLDGKELTALDVRNGVVSRRGRSARMTAGNAIERVEFRRAGRTGRATITIVEDFTTTQRVLDREAWGPVFTRVSLRGALGLEKVTQHHDRRAAARTSDDSIDAPATPLAAPFLAPCANCHRSLERSPPNFLYGEPARIDSALRQCAPRMLVRLAMWQTPAADRVKVPMPPPRAAHDGMPAVQTDADPAVASLQATVAEWLRQETGSKPDVSALLSRGYENLRPCLPPGT